VSAALPPGVARALDAALAAAVDALDPALDHRLTILSQDATESVRRLSRWDLWRRGVRVPFADLVVSPLSRAVDTATRQLGAAGAGPPPGQAARILAAQAVWAPFAVARDAVDLVLQRPLLEGELAFRARFDEALRHHAEAVVRPLLRAHLAAHADRVRAAWAHLDSDGGGSRP
jgi:hypothetical protein